jgi:hypothetical protein
MEITPTLYSNIAYGDHSFDIISPMDSLGRLCNYSNDTKPQSSAPLHGQEHQQKMFNGRGKTLQSTSSDIIDHVLVGQNRLMGVEGDSLASYRYTRDNFPLTPFLI